MNVLILPDKFKGTLTARAAAQAIAAGWRRGRSGDSLSLLPMSDGGDGFGGVLGGLMGAREQKAGTVDAAHRPCVARWWWEPKTRTAVIESAAAIGLAMLPPGEFHPFALDTFGLGAIIEAAAAKGARRCLMGIGGSATNDGGFGMARALGWRFLDGEDRPIEQWTYLERLERIQAPPRRLRFGRWLVAVDVQNPLLGPRGATRVYGPQKGLSPGDFARAESCLLRLARVVKEQFGRRLAGAPGAGAAGGLGFGLLAFAGARLEPGFDVFARQASLTRRLRQADLVITGEGAIDRSTLMGKGGGEIASRCAQLHIPCLGLAGVVAVPARQRTFARLSALTELTSVAEARAKAPFWLRRLAHQAALGWPGA